MNLMSSTLLTEDAGVPFHELQAEQIRLFREAWAAAGHQREPRVSVSRSIFALVDDRDRAYFGRGNQASDQVGYIDAQTKAIFGRSYAAEPDVLVKELARRHGHPGGGHAAADGARTSSASTTTPTRSRASSGTWPRSSAGADTGRYCVPMEETGPAVELDEFLPRDVRTFLEERFWRPIEAQATLEVLRDDPEFLADPGRHPAIFADHGVVHVRDVAIGLTRLLDTINGVLLPCRSPERQRFVQALGVGLAYLHDIGMVDMTRSGRRVHALFAAHAAFGPDVGPLVDHLLATGPVGARLAEIAAQAPFATSLEVVLREMLSMSVAHSKSAVPADVLDDRAAFRRLMQRVIFTTLDDHRAARQLPRATDTSRLPADANTDRYDDPSESFAWLSRAERPACRAGRRCRGRLAGAAGRGRAATTRHRPAHVGWVRGVHGCRDRTGRVHAATGDRRRRVRDHLRRRPRRRRGQRERRVRDAAGPPAHRVPPRRVRERGSRPACGGERRGRRSSTSRRTSSRRSVASRSGAG